MNFIFHIFFSHEKNLYYSALLSIKNLNNGCFLHKQLFNSAWLVFFFFNDPPGVSVFVSICMHMYLWVRCVTFLFVFHQRIFAFCIHYIICLQLKQCLKQNKPNRQKKNVILIIFFFILLDYLGFNAVKGNFISSFSSFCFCFNCLCLYASV